MDPSPVVTINEAYLLPDAPCIPAEEARLILTNKPRQRLAWRDSMSRLADYLLFVDGAIVPVL
jgi:hypothetical protein